MAYLAVLRALILFKQKVLLEALRASRKDSFCSRDKVATKSGDGKGGVFSRTGIDICLSICHVAGMERHVKLFKNGRNQAVRIPREFELPGEDAIIRKEGQRLIIEPAPPQSLLAVLAALPTLDEELPPIQDSPAEPVDL